MKLPKVRKLPSGKYFCQLRLTNPDGVKQSISITEDTEKLCIAKAAAIKGGLVEQQKALQGTLYGAINEYIRLRENILSPSTILFYRIVQENRFKDYMKRPIKEMDEKNIQAMINQEAKLVSWKTLKNAWGFVSSVLRESTGKSFKVILPQGVKKEKPFLDYEQIKIFLRVIKGDKYEIPALLALCSLRRSEILALTWDKVDFKNKRIYVHGATVPDENHQMVDKETNKNSSSRRTVPIMIPRLIEALESVQNKHGKIYQGHPNAIKQHLDYVCKKNKLPLIGVHGLRRSFASLCYHLRVSELECMRIGGWSDWGTMRRVYTKLAEADEKEAELKLLAFYSEEENANKIANESSQPA